MKFIVSALVCFILGGVGVYSHMQRDSQQDVFVDTTVIESNNNFIEEATSSVNQEDHDDEINGDGSAVVNATTSFNGTIDMNISPTQITTTIPPQTKIDTELMAWMYPGAPSCRAMSEIADGRRIDVIKAEYFTISDEGSLKFLTATNDGCNGFSEMNLLLLKQYSKTQYVTISVNYTDAMEHFLNNGVESSIRTLISFVVDNDMTGIELDFEDFGGWNQELYVQYKQFVTALGNSLHERGKKLMIDGPATSDKIEEAWYVWRYQDFMTLPVDQMVIMMYDYQFDNGVGTPVSPLSWIEKVVNWTSGRYTDTHRIVVGLPSYGYKGTEGTQKMSLLTYEQAKKEPGFETATRDTSSGEMMWKNGASRYYYQDSESLNQKRAVVEKLGIHSISVWHLGGNQWF